MPSSSAISVNPPSERSGAGARHGAGSAKPRIDDAATDAVPSEPSSSSEPPPRPPSAVPPAVGATG